MKKIYLKVVSYMLVLALCISMVPNATVYAITGEPEVVVENDGADTSTGDTTGEGTEQKPSGENLPSVDNGENTPSQGTEEADVCICASACEEGKVNAECALCVQGIENCEIAKQKEAAILDVQTALEDLLAFYNEQINSLTSINENGVLLNEINRLDFIAKSNAFLSVVEAYAIQFSDIKTLLGEDFIRIEQLNKSMKDFNDTSNNKRAVGEISLEVARDQVVDVKLAVGSTKVNYANFAADLTAALTKLGLKGKNINIEASQEQGSSTSSSFSWNSYDHSANSGTYNTKYIENTNDPAQGTNDYNSLDRHIVSSNNGTVMDFYGYGSSGFKDFNFLKNEQATKKTIEYTITEGEAYDAFDGIGFFINSSITGTYPSTEVINGYLVFFQYSSGGAGETIKLFKLDNVNTYQLHHGEKSAAFRSVTAGGISMFGGTITLLNTAATTYGAYKNRKIKIEAEPEKLTVWYNGSNSDNSKMTLTDSNLVSWSTGKSYALNAQFDGSVYRGGFGPIASYTSHNCSQLTRLRIANVKMTAEYVKSLTEIVRAPKWDEDATSFLVNLNEAPIDDFSKDISIAEIINRLRDDDISYIGWCGKLNADASKIFTQSLNGGALVNVDDSTTNTYTKQIDAIANAIKKGLPSNKPNTNTFLVNDTISFKALGNIALDDGKWQVKYSSVSFDDAKANGETTNFKDISKAPFSTAGYYCVYHSDQPTEPLTSIKVHRRPIVDFRVTGSASTGITTVTDGVTDLDDGSIKPENIKIEYRNQTAQTAWTTTRPTSISPGHVWMVSVTATDSDGVSTTVVKQVSLPGASDGVSVPYGSFTISNSQIVFPVNTQIVVNDQSYGLSLGDVVTSTYKIYASDGTLKDTFTLSAGGTKTLSFLQNNYPDGTYTIKMKSKATRDGKTSSESPEVSQSFVVSTGYSIKYVAAGGKNIPTDQIKAKGVDIALSTLTPTHSNYLFSYWKDTSTGGKTYAPGDTFNVDKDTTLTAMWMYNTPTGLKWERQTAKWNQVAGGSDYKVTLYRVDNTKAAAKIFETTTSNVSYDFRSKIGSVTGQYYFTVAAVAQTGDSIDDSVVSSKSASINGYTPGGTIPTGTLTQDDIDDIFGNNNAKLISNDPLKVQIQQDFTLDAPLIFNQDIEIDLNGHTITGPKSGAPLQSNNTNITITNSSATTGKITGMSGADSSVGDGGAGSSAILTGSGNIAVTGNVELRGGNGGNSTVSEGGKGAAAVSSTNGDISLGKDVTAIGGNGGIGITSGGAGGAGAQTGGTGSITNEGTTTGGNGGTSTNGTGGAGGSGTSTDEGNILNNGTSTGGTGGHGGQTGGAGGIGSDSNTGDVQVGENGSSNGGTGGSGINGGSGGAGASTGGNGSVTNDGTSSGGSGGNGITGPGGNGGAGTSTDQGSNTNNGLSTGGAGGSSTSGTGGTGGAGTGSNTGDVSNNGTSNGGIGGNGETGGNGGAGSTTGGAGSITNEGSASGGSGGSGTTGNGGTGGMGTSTDEGDVTNNGSSSGGTGGSSTSGIGGNGGTGVGSDTGNVGVGENGSANGGAGGNGATGGNGGTGTTTGGTGSVTNDGTTSGGTGGNGTTGNGGSGGSGATTDKGDITNNGEATGGTGGTSDDATGGNGGNGSGSNAGNVDVGENGSSTGGAGGNGTTGGTGGNGSGSNAGNVDVGENGSSTGGAGGNGTTGGTGGNGAITNGDGGITNNGSTTGGNGGEGTTGDGGAGGSGTTTENGDITNNGPSMGGNGGTSNEGTGGTGGSGTGSGTGNIEVGKDGSSTGGNGGEGVTGGTGGSGAETGGTGSVTNDGTTSGGTGGTGTTGDGGAGGAGTTTDEGDITNNGSTTGGTGGSSESGAGGTGGNGSGSNTGNVDVGENGSSSGGAGGNGTTGGTGGNGAATGGTGSVTNDGTTSGGNGGSGTTGNGGAGGTGTSTDKGDITNNGEATGGTGGTSEDAAGGNGGNGSGSNGGNVDVGENGSSTGGSGGSGATGGTGGNGATTGDAGSVTNDGTTSGGDGGNGTTGNGGSGGSGATTDKGDITNNGEATGGTGGTSDDATGGNGGNGSGSNGGNVDVGENGSSTGGAGGNGTTGGSGGSGATAGEDGNVTNDGNATGGSGGSGTTGTGGTGGNGTSTEQGNNTNNGTTSGGNGGTSNDGTGGNGGAGAGSDSGNVDNNGTSSGGTGGSGTTGGNGGSGSETNGDGNVTNNGSSSGGSGGSGTTGNGGTGGNGTTTENGDLNNNGSSTGGNGGTSTDGAGGTGGNGTNSDSGATNNNGSSSGGNGGNSENGTGGTGGNGSFSESGKIDMGDKGTSSGGSGGESENGTTGKGGSGTDSTTGAITLIIDAEADANGSITPKGKQSFVKGSNASFIITPNKGYEIKEVLVDGQNIGKSATYDFTNIEKNHQIKAVFAEERKSAIIGTGDITSMSNMGLTMIGSGSVFTIVFYKAVMKKYEEEQDNQAECFKGIKNKLKFTKFLIEQAYKEFVRKKY